MVTFCLRGKERGLVTTEDRLREQRQPVIGVWQVLFIILIGVAITVCEYVFAYQNVPYGIAIGLGFLATMYLIHRTGGKVSEQRETEFEQRPDGTIKLRLSQETVYASPESALGRFLNYLRKLTQSPVDGGS